MSCCCKALPRRLAGLFAVVVFIGDLLGLAVMKYEEPIGQANVLARRFLEKEVQLGTEVHSCGEAKKEMFVCVCGALLVCGYI